MIHVIVLALCWVALGWFVGVLTFVAKAAFVSGDQGRYDIRVDDLITALVWPLAVWFVVWHRLGRWRMDRRLDRELERKRREG